MVVAGQMLDAGELSCNNIFLSARSPAHFPGAGTSEEHERVCLRSLHESTELVSSLYLFTFDNVVLNDRECKGERPTQQEQQKLVFVACQPGKLPMKLNTLGLQVSTLVLLLEVVAQDHGFTACQGMVRVHQHQTSRRGFHP